MTVVVDAGVVVALLDRDDARHAVAAAWYAQTTEDLVTTPLALAQADDELRARAGTAAQRTLWGDLERGALRVRWWADGLRETVELARRHPDAGLAGASLVALARLERTDRIATFEQHFRSMTLPDGAGLVLLPEDA